MSAERVPSARFFHGLSWPGTDHADIDHVVLVGTRVAVIDTKNWAPGAYWWDGRELYREGQRQRELKVAVAAQALRGKLERFAVDGLEVGAWVALHGHGVSVESTGRPAVRVAPTAEVVAEAAAWLTQDVQGAQVVHRPLMLALVRLVKS